MLGRFHPLGSLILVLCALRHWQLCARGEDVCCRDETLDSDEEFCFIAKLANITHILPCIMCTHIFGLNFQEKKIFRFNFLIQLFI